MGDLYQWLVQNAPAILVILAVIGSVATLAAWYGAVNRDREAFRNNHVSLERKIDKNQSSLEERIKENQSFIRQKISEIRGDIGEIRSDIRQLFPASGQNTVTANWPRKRPSFKSPIQLTDFGKKDFRKR